MTDILHRRLAQSPDAADSAVGDETVILHYQAGEYCGLDAVGTRIWTLIKEGIAPLEICAMLASEYQVAREIIDADTRRFLEDLEARNMVVDA